MPLVALLRKLLKTLNSEGTPNQIAAGIAIGAVLGLTPIANLHNLVLFSIVLLTRVSLSGVFLGWALFVPVGFLLDPQFNAIGEWLLIDNVSMASMWEGWYNTPVIAFTNFNNTVVLGSFICWLVLTLPIFFIARIGVIQYRKHLYERLTDTKLFKTVKASKLYKYYRWFKPEMD